ITKPYIQANPPHLRVWSIHDCDYPGAALAWEAAGLPPPTWAAINRENAHAHLVWGLSAPVLVDGMGARDAPLRYLCAVESCMREKLRADPGYSGLITKNPAHPLWRVLRGPRLAYELGELAEWLPDLDRHKPRQGVNPEAVGLGRNVCLFDRTRKWAYPAVRQYWGGGLEGWNAWLSAVNTRALVYNGDFAQPLDGREVWHLARSVAKWVWRHFTPQSFADLVARTHTSEVQQNRRLSDGRKQLIKEMDSSH
ncbi:MAG: replication initiation protein, partial [Fimbriimonadales bacterium]|nr:replication initiation protein [Fimbriimonadales bacterium]